MPIHATASAQELDVVSAAPIRIRQAALFRVVPEALAAQSNQYGTSVHRVQGFEFLPREPYTLGWTLVASQPPSHGGRRLREMAAAAASHFTRSPLLHTAMPPALHELQRLQKSTLTDGAGTRKRNRDDGGASQPSELALLSAAVGAEPASSPCDERTLRQWLDCLHADAADGRGDCIEAIRDAAHEEPAWCARPILKSLAALLHSPSCGGVQAGRCAGVVNALARIRPDAPPPLNEEACDALASWLRRPDVTPSLPTAAFLAILTDAEPCTSMLEALAALTQSFRFDVSATDGAEAAAARLPANLRERLLIVGAAAAKRVRGTAQEPASERASWEDAERRRTAAAEISASVLASLQAALEASAQWDGLHERAATAAEHHWEHVLTAHEREAWVGHHAQLQREGLEWASRHAEEWRRHESVAREQLRRRLLEASDAFDTKVEEEQPRVLIAALRAAGNLGRRHHQPDDSDDALLLGVRACLLHRAPAVIEAAADTLRSHPHPHAEVALVKVLERTEATHHGARRRVLESLLKWPTAGTATVSTAVAALLRTPLRDARHCQAACASRCNPHAKGDECKVQCERACSHEAEAGQLYAKLVRRAAPQGHDLAPLLRQHGRATHPSRMRVALASARSEVSAWHTGPLGPLLLANRTAQELARIIHDEHHSGGLMSPGESMSSDGLRSGQVADDRLSSSTFADRAHRDGGRVHELGLPAGASMTHWRVAARRRGRALRYDWQTFDFDKLSLTFIDIILSHPPLDWVKTWGDPKLMGDLGGAGESRAEQAQCTGSRSSCAQLLPPLFTLAAPHLTALLLATDHRCWGASARRKPCMASCGPLWGWLWHRA